MALPVFDTTSVAPGRRSQLALSVALAAGAWVLLSGYLWTAATRLQLDGTGPAALAALFVGALLLVVSPFHGSYLVILAIPLFGNHPGGRLMELLDVGLAACTLGLCVRGLRLGSPLPRSPVWRAAGLVLLSAAIALLPTLPAFSTWMGQIASPGSAIVQTLSAAETTPLYSLGTAIELALAVAWAYSLCWAGASRKVALNLIGCTAVALFAVVVLGALDFHHVIDIRYGFLARIDRHLDYLDRFQSVFWNPGWFAWYFTIAFGLSAGLLWVGSQRWRWAVAAGLATSYLYFMTNSQRGGWIALHAVLVALLWFRTDRFRVHRRLAIAAVVVGAAALLALALVHLQAWPERWLQALRRLSTPQPDINRWTLWLASLRMWRSAPLFGVGEGSFAWRYYDFGQARSGLDVGDAHNTWLQLLATRGLFGLWAFAALVMSLVRTLGGSAAAPGFERAIHRGVVLGLTAFLTYSLVQHLFYLQCIQVLFWAMVALATIISPAGPSTEIRTAPGRRWMRTGALLAALLLQIAWSLPQWRTAVAQLARQPRGFYPLQNAARRWSSRKGTLCLYPSGPVMTVELSTADPTAAIDPVTVTLSTSGRVVDRFDLWRRRGLARTIFLYEVLGRPAPVAAPPFGECAAGPTALPLTVEVSRLWTPRSVGSLDGRLLGVNVIAPSFRAVKAAEEIGLTPPGPAASDARWMGARASLQLHAPGPRAFVSASVRAPAVERKPMHVEAWWNQHLAAESFLADRGWHELRFSVDGGEPPGVLTLQASELPRPERLEVPGAPKHAGLQIGRVSIGELPSDQR